jgi:hypothetical protein
MMDVLSQNRPQGVNGLVTIQPLPEKPSKRGRGPYVAFCELGLDGGGGDHRVEAEVAGVRTVTPVVAKHELGLLALVQLEPGLGSRTHHRVISRARLLACPANRCGSGAAS